MSNLRFRPSPEEFGAYVRVSRTDTRVEPHRRGCDSCGGGWVETESGDIGQPSTVRPCDVCCPEQYQHWLTGALSYKPHAAVEIDQPLEPERMTEIMAELRSNLVTR